VILLVVGIALSALLFQGPLRVMSVTFDYHTLLYSTAAILLGYQSLLLFVFAKLMAVETGLHPLRTKFWFLEERRTLEQCVTIGLVLMLAGVVVGIIAPRQWELTGFGPLRPDSTIRVAICSVLFLLLGGQTLLAGFYFGLINLVAERRTHRRSTPNEAPEVESTQTLNGTRDKRPCLH